MDQNGILIILLYSVFGTKAYIPHRYHFVNKNKNWSEAQTYCREKYTDLASINNMEEMMKLNNTLKMETANQAWIGLQRGDTRRWQWSLADQTLYRDGDTYRNWSSGEENNTDEFCADIANDGSWYSCRCNVTLPFVCYKESNTQSNHYIINNETKPWRAAQTNCRKHYIDLVSVRNQTENEEIRNMIQNFSNVWIGLFVDRWKWSDQSNSSFRYWSSNKPSGGLNCAAVNVSDQLYWSDVDCTENLPFICHENKLVLIKQNLTWKKALRYCRNNHYDLVSVLTQEMQLWVKEAARNASTEHVWLGLRHTCTLGFWYWVTGETICYQDWAPGNGTGFEDCRDEERTGAVQSGGEQQWISLPESNTLNFICSNYEEKSTDSNGYMLIEDQKTWHDAQTYCRKNYIDLVSVRNKTENEEIKKMIHRKNNYDGFLIGLLKYFWKWSDQSNSSFRYWSSNKPTQD